MSSLGGIEDVGASLNLPDVSSATTIDTYSIDNMTITDTSGYGENYNGAPNYTASVIGAIGTVASTLISVAAKKDAMEQKTKEITVAMEATVKEYEFMASVNEQQMDAVERVVGDKMSETGLKRLKDKASLRAAAAMSGTVGGTTNAVIQEASIIEMMDNAVIIANGRQQKAALSQKIQGQYISAQNRINSLAAGIQSSTGAGLQMIDAGLQGFSKAYMALPASERRKYFGYTIDN